MSSSEYAETLEWHIGSLNAVREALLEGVEIEKGGNIYEKLLQTSVAITEILDEVDDAS